MVSEDCARSSWQILAVIKDFSEVLSRISAEHPGTAERLAFRVEGLIEQMDVWQNRNLIDAKTQKEMNAEIRELVAKLPSMKSIDATTKAAREVADKISDKLENLLIQTIAKCACK